MQNVDIMCFNGGFIVVVDGPIMKLESRCAEFYQNEMGGTFLSQLVTA